MTEVCPVSEVHDCGTECIAPGCHLKLIDFRVMQCLVWFEITGLEAIIICLYRFIKYALYEWSDVEVFFCPRQWCQSLVCSVIYLLIKLCKLSLSSEVGHVYHVLCFLWMLNYCLYLMYKGFSDLSSSYI